jgi:hypothetical protein
MVLRVIAQERRLSGDTAETRERWIGGRLSVTERLLDFVQHRIA